MKTGRYSIKDLLTHNEIEQIIIPEIQRDYVWKEKNVKKLLESIISKFNSKTKKTLKLEIKGEFIENGSIEKYLQKEYNKLIFNTKIGFIYAYHDNEYAGKFFLIDGQQRFTTLYLLLLAVYAKSDKKNSFRTLYFKNDILKIDYKVREHSHDFMMEFVKNELSDFPIDIKISNKYYTNEYEDDETIKNLISNYNAINKILEKNKENISTNNYKEFIEYIEDYIEVNYFDTNISEQGEQLYLYMNSRGEFLSHQELVKSEIIKKEKDLEKKKQIGENWENWQNFFWRNRSIETKQGNENADIGFQEFLKWCTILHICTTDSEQNIEFEIVNDKKQTFREAKENYINKTKDKVEVQKEYLTKYQVKQLDANYLGKTFSAVKELSNIKSDYIPINKNWLFNISGAINYVEILPLIYFIQNSHWDNENDKERDVKRLAMFLNNSTSFLSIAKNPDSSTIDAIDLVKSMCDNSQTDITSLIEPKYVNKYRSFLNLYTKQKLLLYKQAEKRSDLEKVIWEILLNNKLNKFLNGDVSILFKTVDKYFNYAPVFNQEYIDTLKQFGESLITILEKYDVYDNGNMSDVFRRALLTFGDYSIKTIGSYRFGDRMEGYSFGYSDTNNDNKEMIEIFQSKNGYVEDLLIALKNKNTTDLQLIINDYKKSTSKDWRESFIENDSILKYCNKKRILREGDKQIILILEKDKGYKYLQCTLLKQHFSIEKMQIHQHNICFIDFDIINDKIQYKKDRYAIDLEYQNNEWHFTLLYRDEDKSKEKLKVFTENNWGVINNKFRLLPTKSLIYTDKNNLSIIENIKNVKNLLDLKLQEIENILTKVKNIQP